MKTFANYHTHTYHCRHANGKPKEYVDTAIENGLDILGFSDHVPYPSKNGFVSGMRMPLSETEKYAAEMEELKKAYNGKIKIYTGYEAEYFPDYFDAMIKNIGQYGYDYLILGQHFTDSESDGFYSGNPCGEEQLKKYVDQVIEAMKTGMFAYVAHPDLINYRENKAVYKREMTRLCSVALDYDIPLEFNLLGFRENRFYPYSEFWKLVSETGCKTIIGWDVHSPEFAGDRPIYNEALAELKKYGITPVETIEKLSKRL